MINPFDRYDWVARIFPAFLTMLPLIVLAFVLFPKTMSVNLSVSNTGLGLLFCCMVYLFASVARFRGENVEPRLIQSWNGWPTTAMLRHHDITIDATTKARYHSALSALSHVPMPSAEQEAAAPGA